MTTKFKLLYILSLHILVRYNTQKENEYYGMRMRVKFVHNLLFISYFLSLIVSDLVEVVLHF